MHNMCLSQIAALDPHDNIRELLEQITIELQCNMVGEW